MNLNDYYKVIKREKWTIILTVIFCFAVFSGLYYFTPAEYEASFYFTLDKGNNAPPSNLESYYYIQTMEKTSDFLGGWLQAQLRNLPEYGQVYNFSSRLVSFEVVGVRFYSGNNPAAQVIYEKANMFFTEKISKLNGNIYNKDPLSFEISNLKIEAREKDVSFYFSGALFFGIILGLFAAFIRFLLRKE